MRFFQHLFGKPQPSRKTSRGFGQTFVLEPILTPSGLLDIDGGDESPDFDSIDIPDLEPVELSDFASHPFIDDADLEDIDFFGADGDPELLADSTLEVDASERLEIDSDTDFVATSDQSLDDLEPPDDSGDAEDFLLPPIVENDTKAVFDQGTFTVGSTGQIGVDFLYDGGSYQGELAIFNIDGLEDFDFDNPEEFRAFLLEASDRALSDSTLGHVVINDLTEGAKFSGNLPEGNFNAGEYGGVKTFAMNPGDRFAVMVIPNGSVQRLHDILSAGEDIPSKLQPLFSLGTANPNDAFHMGQIADVTGDGNTFAMEDLRTDGWTDQDYNDIVFQVRGATGEASLMDEVVNPDNDWRGTDIGQALIEYAKPYVEPEAPDWSVDAPIESDVPFPEAPVDSDVPFLKAPVDSDVPLQTVPREQQPLIGVIDTGFSSNNPDLDYSHIILGRDRVDGDANPLLNPGEGSEHGTHILGIIGATQDNGIGIDGINDTAPIWVGRAVGSGQWADSLVEFVDAAVESGQPNAVVNLSLDLTQVNPDGSVTTRYEFTPQERAAIEYARQHNVLMVVAAGNDGGVMSALGQSSQEFDNIVTVGAAERVNEAVASSNAYDGADYSSYGYGLDIMASGGSVSIPELSLSGDGVGTMAGTSVATAKVTGAVSQVWAANPGLSYRQVIEILKDTATDLKDTGWDFQSGAGLLNMAAAIHLAKATQPEEYEVLPTLIPDTWGGEGKVTPMERAAATEFMGKYYDWERYTIRSGDTLSAIAIRTMGSGTAPYYNFIAQKNGIANPNLIYPGTIIWVPKQVAAPTPTPPKPTPTPTPAPPLPTAGVPGQSRQYIVRSGDTLWSIAQRQLGNGNRWREIMKTPTGGTFTDAEARQLRVGQSVYLPVNSQIGTGTPVTPAPVTTPAQNIQIRPGANNLSFYRGQQWVTPNGYKFIFQHDGNLVMYNPQGQPTWATGTNGTGANRFAVQADGNVVLYDGNQAVWASNTSGNPGAYFAIQGDGNLVVYTAGGRPIFATGTDGGRQGTKTAAADWLRDRNLKRFPGLKFSTVVSKATGKALDAGGSNNSVYPHPSPNSGNNFHQWGFEKVGDYYMLINKATGKALDAGGSNSTLPYVHYDPQRNNPYQLWKLAKVGDAYIIVNKATGKALDSGGASGKQIYMHPTPLSWNPYHLWKLNLPGGSSSAILSKQNAQYFKDRPQFYTSGNIFSKSNYGSRLVDGRSQTEGNCTWYAHGRVLELGGNSAALHSMSGNANQWHTQISNGSRIVFSPQPGDIAQWTRWYTNSKGQRQQMNHVAVVEKVNGDGTIVISESHWRSEYNGSTYIGYGKGTLHNVRTIRANNPDRYIRVPGVKIS